MSASLELFVTCPRGLESVLAGELRALKARSVRPLTAGVSCAGDLACAYRLCLNSRVASRVLMALGAAPAESADDLYAAVRAVAWERLVAPDGTIAVDFVGSLPGVTNTMFGAVRAKDAVVDRMRELSGRRPDVDPAAPDLRVNVSARRGRVTVSADLSGEALHRRGYREPGVQVAAPLKENLAAGLLLLAGWKQVAERGGVFVDPLCGSGTLA
ncbi:MAG: 23S rRNA (guanine(2445)-N(2))/(guanine(2069)-N(7))-methyltransferase, partial [Coriobacteriaceae bacterium]|nr:23S rRNA (guanine(2445)-N(2))/(guanine(2069)-N(7))-methyltransferase [Coriobacteriaceae bacterium]